MKFYKTIPILVITALLLFSLNACGYKQPPKPPPLPSKENSR